MCAVFTLLSVSCLASVLTMPCLCPDRGCSLCVTFNALATFLALLGSFPHVMRGGTCELCEGKAVLCCVAEDETETRKGIGQRVEGGLGGETHVRWCEGVVLCGQVLAVECVTPCFWYRCGGACCQEEGFFESDSCLCKQTTATFMLYLYSTFPLVCDVLFCTAGARSV